MKRKIITGKLVMLSVIAFCQSANAQEPGHFIIKGNIKDAQKVLLYRNEMDVVASDSVVTKQGQFQIQGTTPNVEYSELAIRMPNGKSKYVNIMLEQGTIIVNSYQYDEIIPKGTFNNNLIYKFSSNKAMMDSSVNVAPYYDSVNYASKQLFDLRKEEHPDDKKIAAIEAQDLPWQNRVNSYMDWYTKEAVKYIRAYPKTYFAVAFMDKLGLDLDSAWHYYNNLGPKIQNSKMGLALKKSLEGQKLLQQGTTAPNFTTTDYTGKKISLSDFKGKIVLLDFWATWCGPCRAGNPHLIEMYKKYHDKGLEIIGIADDDNNIQGWKKAISTDNIGIWHQVLQGVKSTADNSIVNISQQYNISSLPTEYLVDKEGKIISAVDNSQLDEILSNLFNQQ